MVCVTVHAICVSPVELSHTLYYKIYLHYAPPLIQCNINVTAAVIRASAYQKMQNKETRHYHSYKLQCPKCSSK